MKNRLILLVVLTGLSFSSSASLRDEVGNQELCKVKVCNRIERFSLDIWSHIKDNMGETCMNIVLPKDQAIVDSELSSESRWWQGSSINPTKKSVTRVKEVLYCEKGE